MKKAKVFLIGLIVLLLMLPVGAIVRAQIAITRAKEYVAQKYDFDVTFEHSGFSVHPLSLVFDLVRPTWYWVFFTENDSSISFAVVVQSDATIRKDYVREGKAHVADNYFLGWVDVQAESYLQDLLAPLSNVGAVSVYTYSSPPAELTGEYTYAVDATFKDDVPTLLNKMDKYYLYITYNYHVGDPPEVLLQNIMDVLAEQEIFPTEIRLWDSQQNKVILSTDDL